MNLPNKNKPPLEVSSTLYSSNCDMFSLVLRDSEERFIGPIMDSFTLGFKDATISPIHNHLSLEYDNHPGFGGNTDRIY